MNIAELFVNLGITGNEKTAGALIGVKRGLGDAKSMALETKAALVAAMYAVERLFSSSSRTGNDLKNFNAELGVSTDELQRYQYAARQVGVSNEAVSGTFKNLQSTMTKVLMGEGVPKGLARVALTVDDMKPEDIEKYAKAPQKLLLKLQEYAQKEKSLPLRNEVLKSFGLGDDMIAALSRNAFRPDIMQKAPTYNPREIMQLDKNNAAWSNLGNKIEMAFGHFNAKHGAEIIDGLTKITDQVIKLADAFMILVEKLNLFELAKDAVKGWTIMLEGAAGAVDKLSGAMDDPKKAEALKEGVKSFFTNDAPQMLDEFWRTVLGDDFYKSHTEAIQEMKKNMGKPLIEKVPPGESRQKPLVVPVNPTMPATGQLAPKMPDVTNNHANQTTQNITVNQQNTFANNDGRDFQRTGDGLKRSVNQAFRQLSAQSQGA